MTSNRLFAGNGLRGRPWYRFCVTLLACGMLANWLARSAGPDSRQQAGTPRLFVQAGSPLNSNAERRIWDYLVNEERANQTGLALGLSLGDAKDLASKLVCRQGILNQSLGTPGVSQRKANQGNAASDSTQSQTEAATAWDHPGWILELDPASAQYSRSFQHQWLLRFAESSLGQLSEARTEWIHQHQKQRQSLAHDIQAITARQLSLRQQMLALAESPIPSAAPPSGPDGNRKLTAQAIGLGGEGKRSPSGPAASSKLDAAPRLSDSTVEAPELVFEGPSEQPETNGEHAEELFTLTQEYRSAKAELQVAEQKYTDRHPRLQAIRDQVASLAERLEQLQASVVRSKVAASKLTANQVSLTNNLQQEVLNSATSWWSRSQLQAAIDVAEQLLAEKQAALQGLSENQMPPEFQTPLEVYADSALVHDPTLAKAKLAASADQKANKDSPAQNRSSTPTTAFLWLAGMVLGLVVSKTGQKLDPATVAKSQGFTYLGSVPADAKQISRAARWWRGGQTLAGLVIPLSEGILLALGTLAVLHIAYAVI